MMIFSHATPSGQHTVEPGGRITFDRSLRDDSIWLLRIVEVVASDCRSSGASAMLTVCVWYWIGSRLFTELRRLCVSASVVASGSDARPKLQDQVGGSDGYWCVCVASAPRCYMYCFFLTDIMHVQNLRTVLHQWILDLASRTDRIYSASLGGVAKRCVLLRRRCLPQRAAPIRQARRLLQSGASPCCKKKQLYVVILSVSQTFFDFSK